MRKICGQSLIIGIGMGMIMTASFNYFWNEKNVVNELVTENVVAKDPIVSSIEGIKKGIDSKKENKNNGMEQEKTVENNSGEKKEEQSKEDFSKTIVVASGMNTNSIAKLLLKEGIIRDSEEFINLAHERNYTKKFIAGPKIISETNTLEEILEILISR